MNPNVFSNWLDARRRAFGENSSLYEYSFETDNGSVPQMEHIRRYAARWEDLRQKNVGLLLWGRPGNGKTFAAACIANALMDPGNPRQTSVRMATFGAILRRLLAMAPLDREEYFRDLCDCDLLILDDFGMERQTEYAREQIFNLIDSRYLSRKPLIVTTNLSLQQLRDPGDLVQERIYDRILEMCVPVFFDGSSFRSGKGEEKFSLLRQVLTASSGDDPG